MTTSRVTGASPVDGGDRGGARRATPEGGPGGFVSGLRFSEDPYLWASGLVALVVYLLQGFDGMLTRDLGLYAYSGQQVAKGELPYEAVLNRTGPLAHLVPGFGAWVGNQLAVDDLYAMRATLMVVSVLAVMGVYLLARDLFDSRGAGLASAAMLLSSQGFQELATFGPREKTTMVCCFAFALVAMVRQRWGTSGAFIALATLAWQPVAFPAIPGVIVAALLGAGPSAQAKVRALVRIAVGGAIPTAIIVFVYVAKGQLGLFLDNFLLINMKYTEQMGMLSDPLKLWTLVWAFTWTLPVFLLGTVAMLVFGIVAAVRPTRSTPRGAALSGLAVVVVISLIWSLRAFNGWADALFLMPAAAAGIGGIVALVASRLPKRAATAVTVAWVVIATSLASVKAIDNRSDLLPEMRRDTLTVVSALPRTATILSIEAPQALVLSHRVNPSRIQLFGQGLIGYIDATWPGGLEGYGRWIRAQHPTVIVTGANLRASDRHWIKPLLKQRYEEVGTSWGPITWYISLDVPQKTRDRLRAELPEYSES